MKVGIVAPSSVPFMLGGAERLWNGLARAINDLTPHDAELIKLPTREHNLPDLMASYEMWARLDVSHFDLVISSKYPAWMVDHPNHVVYLQHTLRGLYEMYPSDLPRDIDFTEPSLMRLERALASAVDRSSLSDVFGAFWDAVSELGASHPGFAFPGPLARALVHRLDSIAMAPSAIARHLAISATVAARPDYFPPGVRARAVHHPSDLVGFRCSDFDYIFTASRLDGPKRLATLVEAMRHVSGDTRLKIAGTGPELPRLQALAAGDPRIEFLGFVSTEQLLDLYANALVVPFIPMDEDLGLITLEAMMSRKPVITAVDSGGSLELVADGRTGFVVPPTPAAVGSAIARLVADRALARSLGEQGRTRAEGVTWERTVEALLGADRQPPRRVARQSRRAGRLVVTSTFPIHPRRGGGQLRCFHLYRTLTERFDVEVVSLTGPLDVQEEIELDRWYVETVVPKSAEHEAAEQALHADVDVPITDIAASLLIEKTPAYLEALAKASAGADAIILADPFQQPAAALAAPGIPTIYDSFNAEILLKTALLPDNATGRMLVETVRRVEAAAVQDSLIVSVCSSEDQGVLEHLYGLDRDKVVYAPNGVDTTATAFTTGEERARLRDEWLDRYRALSGRSDLTRLAFFAGSWHIPNIDAAEHIVEIAPALPHVLFLLVGQHGEAFDRWALPSNVVLTGIVSDTVKHVMLSSADVALNPMTRGSGTNLKIVEYFAAGVPVVSTPLGSRGLAVRDGEHLRLAELDAGAFTQAVDAVLADPGGAGEVAQAARALVEREYDWRVAGTRLLDRLRLVLGP